MSTLDELQQLLQDKYDIAIGTVAPDAPMQDSGMDSLAIAEFMFAVEDHFHITLTDDDPSIDTLAKLADLIDRIKAAGPPPPKAPPVPASGVPASGVPASSVQVPSVPASSVSTTEER